MHLGYIYKKNVQYELQKFVAYTIPVYDRLTTLEADKKNVRHRFQPWQVQLMTFRALLKRCWCIRLLSIIIVNTSYTNLHRYIPNLDLFRNAVQSFVVSITSIYYVRSYRAKYKMPKMYCSYTVITARVNARESR